MEATPAAIPATRRPVLAQRTLRAARALLPPLAVGVMALVAWDIVVRTKLIADYVLPYPADVWSRLTDEWPTLLEGLADTVIATLSGFAIATVAGVAIAALLTYLPGFDEVIKPYLVTAQVVPKEALAPIFLLWFGSGTLPRALIAALICFFPIVINTAKGFAAVPHELDEMMDALSARPLERLFKVSLPFALPYLFAALRISIGLALVGAVTAEFIGGSSGIGQLILFNSTTTLDTPLVFAGLVVLAITGLLLFLAVTLVERLAIPWADRNAGGIA